MKTRYGLKNGIKRYISVLSVALVVLGVLIAPGASNASERATQSQFDSDHIAILTIMGEASDQRLGGQVAVGEVIRERMKRRGQTADQVCLAPYQFSFWNDRAAASAWIERHGTGEAYQRASRAWEESETSNLIGGADHYFNPRLARPSWAQRMKHTVTIGEHSFYRG